MSKGNQKLISRVDEQGRRIETFKEITPTTGDPLNELAAILAAGQRALFTGNYAAVQNCLEVALDSVAQLQDGK